jgi:hypothetical protein
LKKTAATIKQSKDESNDGNDKQIHNNNTSEIIVLLQLPLTTKNQFSSKQQAKHEFNDIEELRTSEILKNTTMSWTSADFSLANTKEETIMPMFTFSIVHTLLKCSVETRYRNQRICKRLR